MSKERGFSLESLSRIRRCELIFGYYEVFTGAIMDKRTILEAVAWILTRKTWNIKIFAFILEKDFIFNCKKLFLLFYQEKTKEKSYKIFRVIFPQESHEFRAIYSIKSTESQGFYIEFLRGIRHKGHLIKGVLFLYKTLILSW